MKQKVQRYTTGHKQGKRYTYMHTVKTTWLYSTMQLQSHLSLISTLTYTDKF